MVGRLVLGAVACAVAIWLALSYGSERLESRAARVALTSGDVPAKELDEARRLARRSRAWQPDAGPKVLEWRLLYRRGRFGQADAMLEDVLASEPANADAWGYLAQTARDPALAREARRRFRALRSP